MPGAGPGGREIDKPRWPWGGDLDTGKSGLSNFPSLAHRPPPPPFGSQHFGHIDCIVMV